MENLRTGQEIAACRAMESKKDADVRLFDDPYAEAFAGEFGFTFMNSLGCALSPEVGVKSLVDSAAVRVKFLDDFLIDAVSALGIRQVVIPACGGDSRAHRLNLERNGADFYLIDLPEVMEYRDKIFPKKENVHSIAADLRYSDIWEAEMRRFGFDPSAPSVWVIEGFFMYVPLDAGALFLDTVHRLSAPNSRIGGDHFNAAYFTSPFSKVILEEWGKWAASPVSGVDHVPQWFANCGFDVEAIQLGDEKADFGHVSEALKAVIQQNPPPEYGTPDTFPRNWLFRGSWMEETKTKHQHQP